ncbi:MAG: LCP family protein [Anaerolineales bacterium]|jgi:LCP family protein required for cell wall assembly
MVKKLSIKSVVIYLGLFIGVGFTVMLAGAVAYFAVRELVLSPSMAPPGGEPQFTANQPTQMSVEEDIIDNVGPPAPEIEPELEAWDGAGRVTLLLLGLDYRDWSEGKDYSRSDTMILLTLDPLTRTAGILSIPRDLWVSIPGFKHNKINTAYYSGEAHKLPGGGPGLAVKTVEELLGVPINFYAQIDFGAFVRFIDELGGVKLVVPEPITIDLLGGGHQTKKRLEAGEQVLPGQWALAYARARNTEGGDFDRAFRQQQVILGIRDRILDFQLLPILLGKADDLYRELSTGIHTNMSLDQVLRLAVLASQVPRENIKQGIIGEKYVIFARSSDNLSILIPVIDKIHVLRDDIFASSGALTPQSPGSAQERMVYENANVYIQNRSRSNGLAERTAEYLRSLGVNVSGVDETPDGVALTTLINRTGKPHTARYLVDLIGISDFKVVLDYDPNSRVDIELILGNDWATSNSMP